MKAIVQDGYGSPDVLHLREIDRPAMGDDEVLVRVHAAGLNAGDSFIMRGFPVLIRLTMGLRAPRNGRVAGWDVAGRVEAVGGSVTQFQPGDDVYGACGTAGGALAEYACLRADRLAPKPVNLDWEQAAAIPVAACTALRGLRDAGQLRAGQQVLINGAAGGVGTFAVQIAKALGAEVTGVCSTKNLDLVRSLGADHVVDYTQEDFTRNGPRYDLILDNAGSRSFADLRRALTPQGVLVPNTGHAGMSYVIKAFALSAFVPQVARMYNANTNSGDLTFIKGLVESGQVTPVIDRTCPLSGAPQAIAYVGLGHARGKVVVTL